jgi:acetyltransferase-like isoleucine patch superfamily enzyme
VVIKGTSTPYSILVGIPAAVVKARFPPAETARIARMQVADLEPGDIPD